MGVQQASRRCNHDCRAALRAVAALHTLRREQTPTARDGAIEQTIERALELGILCFNVESEAELARIGHTLKPLEIVVVNTRAGSRYGEKGSALVREAWNSEALA